VNFSAAGGKLYLFEALPASLWRADCSPPVERGFLNFLAESAMVSHCNHGEFGFFCFESAVKCN